MCTPSRLVENGTQYDTIGSIVSTSITRHRVIGTPSTSVGCQADWNSAPKNTLHNNDLFYAFIRNSTHFSWSSFSINFYNWIFKISFLAMTYNLMRNIDQLLSLYMGNWYFYEQEKIINVFLSMKPSFW